MWLLKTRVNRGKIRLQNGFIGVISPSGLPQYADVLRWTGMTEGDFLKWPLVQHTIPTTEKAKRFFFFQKQEVCFSHIHRQSAPILMLIRMLTPRGVRFNATPSGVVFEICIPPVEMDLYELINSFKDLDQSLSALTDPVSVNTVITFYCVRVNCCVNICRGRLKHMLILWGDEMDLLTVSVWLLFKSIIWILIWK